MTEIDSFSLAAGNSAITSYNLEYNRGDGGSTFYEVIGETDEQLERVVSV